MDDEKVFFNVEFSCVILQYAAPDVAQHSLC